MWDAEVGQAQALALTAKTTAFDAQTVHLWLVAVSQVDDNADGTTSST